MVRLFVVLRAALCLAWALLDLALVEGVAAHERGMAVTEAVHGADQDVLLPGVAHLLPTQEADSEVE